MELTKTINGKVRHFYGKTAREAQAKLDAAFLAGAQLKPSSSQLFEDAAKDWWVPFASNVKPGTLRCYKAAQDRALSEFTGFPMDEITPGMVGLWLNKLAASGYAQSTVKNSFSCVSLIFKSWCVHTNNLYNPCPVVQVPRGLPKTEREPPTEQQLKVIKAHPEGFGLAAWLFMYTGARLGEIVALQWKDIDFDAGLIYITKSVTWPSNQPLLTTTKTKNGMRNIPLLSPLRAQLEQRRGDPAAYILGGKPTPMTKNGYRAAWEGYCRDVDLADYRIRIETHRGKKFETRVTLPQVTAHQFRHEMASMLYEAGIGVMEAQRILGHADITTTQRIYTHLRARQLDNAAVKLEAYLASDAAS